MKNSNTNITTNALTIKKNNSLTIINNHAITYIRISSKAIFATIALTLLNMII